jgi:BCCT, betaine/carnitine/choline family transporter
MRQARQALELEKLGVAYYNNSATFLADGSDLCYEVPQHDIVLDGETVFTNRLPGVTPVCMFNQSIRSAFHVLQSFRFPDTFRGKGMGPLLTVLYLLGCLVFHISMTDSASFMVDKFASNGRKNNHWSRRLLWACSSGALATKLLSLGGWTGVDACVVVGVLPFIFLMCYLMQTITLFCQEAVVAQYDCDTVDYRFPDQPEFAMPVYGGIFNVMEFIVSFGRVNIARVELGMHLPTKFQCVEFVKGLLIPFVSLHQVLESTYPENPKINATVVGCYTVFYVCWTVLLFVSQAHPGLAGLTMTIGIVTGSVLGLIRMGFRSKYNLRSNYLADWMTGTFLWPQVLAQMRLHCVTLKPKRVVGKGMRSGNDDGDLNGEGQADSDGDAGKDCECDIVVST